MLSERNKANREWIKNNPEKRAEQRKRYYTKHREAILARMKVKQQEMFKDEQLRTEYCEKWRRYTRNNYAARLLSSVKSRSKSKAIPFDLSIEDIIIPEYCPKTGIKLVVHTERGKFYDTPSLDRIDSTKGYIKNNVQVVCYWYNVAKLHFTEEIILALCKAVVITSEMRLAQNVGQGGQIEVETI